MDLYIDKLNGTFADELCAYGLLRLLKDAYQGLGLRPQMTLRDAGSHYRLTLHPALTPEQLEGLRGQVLMPILFLLTTGKADQLPREALPHFAYDYEAEETQKDKNADPTPPSPYWEILKGLNDNHSVVKSYNNLLKIWWDVQFVLPEMIGLVFDLFGSHPNALDEVEEKWEELVKNLGLKLQSRKTLLQIFNPSAGQGRNRSKADGNVNVKVKKLEGFWLVEYLKAVGYFEVAYTRLVKGAKDRKTLVLVPRSLDAEQLQSLQTAFHQVNYGAESAIRMDVLAVLRYTEVLLKYYFPSPESAWGGGLGWSPQQEIAGFRTAFYKSLGNSAATMNMAFLALPAWIRVDDEEAAQLFSDLLAELIQFVRQFDESHSDAVTLLSYFRDFLSGGSLSAFFAFTRAFPAYLMSQLEARVRPLSVSFIERFLMSQDNKQEPAFKPILESEGFQAVAYAIRRSTITAQYLKSKGERKYDIRYGLGQDLARKAHSKALFVAALSEFLFKYNAENAQVMETRKGPFRKSVQTEHIEEVIGLIDAYGAPLVANLLIAYGYARVTRSEEAEQESSLNPEDNLEEQE